MAITTWESDTGRLEQDHLDGRHDGQGMSACRRCRDRHATMICERCLQPIMSDQAYTMEGSRRHWPECPAGKVT